MSQDHPGAAELAGLRDALAGLDDPWHCGETRLSRLTRESRRARLGVPGPSEGQLEARTGLPGRMAEFALAASREADDEHPDAPGLPRTFDLRDVDGRGYVTSVKDQGERGSCSAFATVAALETTAAYARRAPGLALDLSEAHLYFGHAAAREAILPDGTWPDEMFADCAAIGVTFEDCYGYTDDDAYGLNPAWRDRSAKATGVVDLSRDPVAIKRHILRHGAVAACLLIYDDLFHYTGGVYRHTTEETSGGHCVALVGWDDDAGCWLAKNSWGEDWGEGGFLRIAYGEAFIEDYPDERPTVLGCTGVSLRAWLPPQRALGLSAAADDEPGWAYLERLGWVRLAGGSDGTTSAFAVLGEAKARRLPVAAFLDDGELSDIRLAGPRPMKGAR